MYLQIFLLYGIDFDKINAQFLFMTQLLKWVFSILFLKMILISAVVANINLEAQIVCVIQIINKKPTGLARDLSNSWHHMGGIAVLYLVPVLAHSKYSENGC